MKQKQLLQICLATSSSSTLFNYRRLNNIVTALYSRRTSYSRRHQRHRRVPSGPSLLSLFSFPGQSQRRRFLGESPSRRSIERLFKPLDWVEMGLERRMSRASPIAAASLDAVMNASSTAFKSETAASATTPISSSQTSEGGLTEEGSKISDAKTSESMPPPQPPATSETIETRSTRSTSSASRNANRLSLTLPIAPPNSFSSRPTPTSSMPPTPVDTLTLNSPVESEDFIVAIAAQERRVLELREELARAESALKKLQRQWTITEACKKRPPHTTAEPRRALAPAANLRDGQADSPVSKRNSELERRKAILLAQSQGASRPHKRTVIRGGHTRTLSLLSPTKPVSDMSIHEDQNSAQSSESYVIQSPAPAIRTINKRATWAPPRSTQQPTGVKQLANDFKQGLWTFVEDLRQATVGDEAVSGTTNRTSGMSSRPEHADGNQDTIRASTVNRGRIPLSAELDSQSNSPDSSSPSSSGDRLQHRRTTSRPEPRARARKHYSWTPLTFDSFDDDDWANWDSPNVKTSRWSGSTVNGDVASAIPEGTNEPEAAL